MKGATGETGQRSSTSRKSADIQCKSRLPMDSFVEIQQSKSQHSHSLPWGALKGKKANCLINDECHNEKVHRDLARPLSVAFSLEHPPISDVSSDTSSNEGENHWARERDRTHFDVRYSGNECITIKHDIAFLSSGTTTSGGVFQTPKHRSRSRFDGLRECNIQSELGSIGGDSGIPTRGKPSSIFSFPPSPTTSSLASFLRAENETTVEGGYFGSAESVESGSQLDPSESSPNNGKRGKRGRKSHVTDTPAHTWCTGNERSQIETAGNYPFAKLKSVPSCSRYEIGDERSERFGAALLIPSAPLTGEGRIPSSQGIHRRKRLLSRQFRKQLEHNSCIDVSGEKSASMLWHKKPQSRFRQCSNSSISLFVTIGTDVMALVLTYLSPSENMMVLTTPFCRSWYTNFTCDPGLWRVLCLSEPFKADINDSCGNDNNVMSYTDPGESKNKHRATQYRLLYSSYVVCFKYLSEMQREAISGRPSPINTRKFGRNGAQTPISIYQTAPHSRPQTRKRPPRSHRHVYVNMARKGSRAPSRIISGIASPRSCRLHPAKISKKTRHGDGRIEQSRQTHQRSGIHVTDRFIRNFPLYWSCDVFSVVSWMVSFSNVEGIQTMCMNILPYLLEDDLHRQAAQSAGLANIILEAMIRFPHSVQLYIAAFHTTVLLTRPLGGREGMLLHCSKVSYGIVGNGPRQHRKSSISVIIEAMNRFVDNEVLQAMSCWSLVNIALSPSQKSLLVRHGGIQATLNAMRHHPSCAEVQFRALFALINLVIPATSSESLLSRSQLVQQDGNAKEREIIDSLVGEVVTLVVKSMVTFCKRRAILNRACLVLHNLSLNPEYHTYLVQTPNCRQLLEWCLANYESDQILERSAAGTLYRLQHFISNSPLSRSHQM